MAFDVEAAKAAGYSQEEIDAFLQGNPREKPLAPVAPGQEVDVGEPPPPSTTVTPAGQGSMLPGLATAGLAAAHAAVPAAIGYGVAKYGGSALDALKNLVGKPGAMPVQQSSAINLNPGSNIQVPQTSGGGARTPAAQNAMQQLRTPPVPTTAPPAAPAPAAQEAQQITRANQIVRQLALDKVMKSAGVPAAVGLGGAALSNTAARQVQAMTPEQRRQLYSSPMMGAMSGDAGLAAAIMNQGQ